MLTENITLREVLMKTMAVKAAAAHTCIRGNHPVMSQHEDPALKERGRGSQMSWRTGEVKHTVHFFMAPHHNL